MQAECAQRLAAAFHDRDAAALLAAIGSALRQSRGAFPALKMELGRLLGAADAEDAGDFVLACVEEGLSGAEAGPAICHLLLDTLAEAGSAPGGATSRARAAAALLRAAAPGGQPRLAPKLASAFGVTADDFSAAQRAALLDAISALLDATATSAAGVALLLALPPLRRYFHLEAVVEDLLLSSQDQVAMRLVRKLGSRELQSLLVQYCLQYGQLRVANSAVKQFELQREFPDVERLHKRRQLEKMAGKGLWGVAATYVGEDGELRRELLAALVAAGELSLAEQQAALWGLQGELDVSPERLAAERAARAARFLQLPLPPRAVHLVECGAGVARMGAALAALAAPPRHRGAAHAAEPLPDAVAGSQPGSPAAAGAAAAPLDDHAAELLPALGLDLEWRPDGLGGGASSPPSILQLSTDSEVWVVDLLALSDPPASAALAAALAPPLASGALLKLGCGLAADLRRLAAAHPAAFGLARACLDLSTLWRAAHVEQTGKRSTAGYQRRAGEVSLSALSQQVLGKPLDKSCQVSDWGCRPLSEAQLRYAALDAHAAVLIFRGMGQLHRPYRTHQGLARHAFTFDARGGGNGVEHAGGGGDGHGHGNGGGGGHGHGGAGRDGAPGGSGRSHHPAAAGSGSPLAGGGHGCGPASGGVRGPPGPTALPLRPWQPLPPPLCSKLGGPALPFRSAVGALSAWRRRLRLACATRLPGAARLLRVGCCL